jgi:hypothetical protein
VLELDPVVGEHHVVAEVEAAGGANTGERTRRGAADGVWSRHTGHALVKERWILEMAVGCGFGWEWKALRWRVLLEVEETESKVFWREREWTSKLPPMKS